MKTFHRIVAFGLGLFLLGSCTSPLLAEATADNDAVASTTYTIYPNPHSITYNAGEPFAFKKDINVVLEDGIDAATKEKAFRLLSEKEEKAHLGTAISSTQPNLLLGIYQSGKTIDSASASSLEAYSNLFLKNDAYYLNIDKANITLVGKDSDAVFMGLSSLSFIFEQSQTEIRPLTIADYSDARYRGFIEGYYGVPWTSEERISLMEFGEKFKTNIYIYAPKDDSYHASNWRGLYSAGDLALLKEQIEAGRRSKTRFAWSIHPFLHNPITSSNYDQGLKDIEAKFEQLYEAGVRQFVISSDDIEASLSQPVDGAFHAKLLNAMQDWCEEKKDCYDLIFVPSAYCYQSATRLKVDLTSYYASLTKDLGTKVSIMWTGDDVCSSMQSGRFNEFQSLTNRKPFFWLNWPVNDYATTHLLMGKAEVLNKTLSAGEECPFSGLVTNPMQQAEESKIAIFAIAAYSWNLNAFSAQESYDAVFPFLDRGDSADLHEICTHLSNATLYEGHYFEESEAIKPAIAAFLNAFDAGADTKASALALIPALKAIASACDRYLEKGSNEALKQSMKPWILSLRDLASASALYCAIEAERSTADALSLQNQFNEAEALIKQRDSYTAKVLNKITYNNDDQIVEVGPAVLTPFLSKVRAIAQDDVAIKNGLNTGTTYYGWDRLYSGSLANMSDNDDTTFAWFEGKPADNAYIRFDYGRSIAISDIRVFQGNASGADIMTGTIEYSDDGRTFSSLAPLSSSATTIIDFRNAPIHARFLRLKNQGTATWVAIKEVQINQLAPVHGHIDYGHIALEPSVTTSICNMIDGDLSTYTWFEINKQNDAYILLDTLSSAQINHIEFLQAKSDSPSDYFRNLTLSYSLDGTTYTTIGTYDDQKEIIVSLTEGITARYIKMQSTSSSSYGVVVREFAASWVSQ